MKYEDLTIKIFADCGAIFPTSSIPQLRISGFTTNPSLISKNVDETYYYLCKRLVKIMCRCLPISLEVVSDNEADIIFQAKLLSLMGDNVYVKIPIVTGSGKSLRHVIHKVTDLGIKVNVTAVMTLPQIKKLKLNASVPSIVSVFAGRISDTGLDPIPVVKAIKKSLVRYPQCELLWASVREPYSLIQAQNAGCDIVTAPMDILVKAHDRFGMDLDRLCASTSSQFITDAESAKLHL